MANPYTDPKSSSPDPAKEGQDRGKCSCPDFPDDPALPTSDQPLRRLINALEGILESSADTPSDATKKFADDLKDCDKEYQGLADVVKKYKETYDKLDCTLSEADKQAQEISDWCIGKVDQTVKGNIENLWKDQYEATEQSKCCEWINARQYVNDLLDCRSRSDKNVDEKKEDFDAIKNFEKTLKDRFTELKSLYDKAKSLRDAERFNSVCAIEFEYSNVRKNLGLILTWEEQSKNCDKNGEGKPKPDADVPPLTIAELGDKLTKALYVLIVARYQRFRWYQDWFDKDSAGKKSKEACEKFRKTRREQFIQEAEDVPEGQKQTETPPSQQRTPPTSYEPAQPAAGPATTAK